jgi:23S rRNA G2445 N2-methylase RlmL
MPKSRALAENEQRWLAEIEVVSGLKPWAEAELTDRFGRAVRPRDKDKPEELFFRYQGESLAPLLTLAKATNVYLLEHYAIPRPLALLGDQNFRRLLAQIETARALHPPGTFRTFRISAAGDNSPAFTRIKDAISDSTGLILHDEEADLVLRIRKSDWQHDGWDVLVRLTPRPLATRRWRVCDRPGALNAVIASAMIAMTDPHPADRFLNPLCGSGTLLIERLAAGPAQAAGGCDIDPEALRCAGQNLTAASHDADLFPMDAAALDLPDACIDVLCADLPWGQLVGSHEDNQTLYPRVLAEAARITAPGGRAAFITHEIRLMERVLAEQADRWRIRDTVRVFQGGLHPRIYLLDRL